ncbi:MAG: type II secretion system protein J [Candidatus Scalinduaceae bacterium]
MRKGEEAFTLLEFIIALSIGAALILIVSFSVRGGFFQMERGSKWLEESYREKSALNFFSQQVSAMRSESSGEDVIFSGDSDRIMFVTPISLERRYGLGLMAVLYYLERDDKGIRVDYKEKRFIPDENVDRFNDRNNTMFDNSESVTIIDGCETIAFQFLGMQDIESTASDQHNHGWIDSWLKNNLPKAIKILMSRDGQNRDIIAPVMAMY